MKTLKNTKLHHTSLFRGYVSRKPKADGTFGYEVPYNGRFGIGFTRRLPNQCSTTYSFIEYHILEDV